MASTVAFKPIDPKRDEFRRYLERAGVIEALTKVVIRIVKERPENPLEYLRTNLGDSKLQADEYGYLQKELDEARTEIDRLRKIIANVNPEALLDEKDTTAGNNNAPKPTTTTTVTATATTNVSTENTETKENAETATNTDENKEVEENCPDVEN